MNIIKLMPDYGCSSIWELNDEGFFEPVDVEDLKIELPNSLKKRIKIWQAKYQNTYNKQNPAESGFKNEKDEESFEKDGLVLWGELTDILTKFEVHYFSIKECKLYKTINNR